MLPSAEIRYASVNGARLDVRNYTPFVPIVYEHYDVDGSLFIPFILKGTFDIVGDGVLRISSRQEPLVKADQYYGEPGRSSVRQESDYVPFKPATDVYFIDPIAWSPNLQPTTHWQVKVAVADRIKTLVVCGPRWWKPGLLSAKLSMPEPCTEVPIRYELAFGGMMGGLTFATNPVGRGFSAADNVNYEAAAPQIERVEDPVAQLGRSYAADGLGPIARSWQPRLKLAGSYDSTWLATKWPVMPDDFSFSHFNCGSNGFVFSPYLTGGEVIRCEGLCRTGVVAFSLPRYTVFILMRCLRGAIIPLPCHMDTVAIDLERKKVFLTWRAKVPAIELRVLEARVFDND